MKNILILSNNCISNSESNGRIHGYFFLDYLKGGHIHNFYLRGNPDIEQVNYLTVSNKNALFSKFSLLNSEDILDLGKKINDDNVKFSKKSKKSKFILFHLLRNNCFFNSKIINELSSYIKRNKIDIIQVWGSNIPFLYKYGYELSTMNNIPLTIFTGEDYPLKKYNFINGFSFLFPFFQKKLYAEAKKAYEISFANIYASKDLMEAYASEYKTKFDTVINFSSSLRKENFTSKSTRGIFYGGNLYDDRCNSLIEVANYLKDTNEQIDVFGSCSKRNKNKLTKCRNIVYHDNVSYKTFLNEMNKSNVLLHIEGFSKKYINDCKYAFSSKLSDYFMSGKKVFIYGPLDISGVKFINDLDSKIVASNKEQLNKLLSVINDNGLSIKYNLIEDLFSSNKASDKMKKIIENCELKQ